MLFIANGQLGLILLRPCTGITVQFDCISHLDPVLLELLFEFLHLVQLTNLLIHTDPDGVVHENLQHQFLLLRSPDTFLPLKDFFDRLTLRGNLPQTATLLVQQLFGGLRQFLSSLHIDHHYVVVHLGQELAVDTDHTLQHLGQFQVYGSTH